MDKTLISRLFWHFHAKVNPEMILNLSRGAAKTLKIESSYKNRNIFSKNKNIFSKNKNIFLFLGFLKNFLFLESRWPAETGWFIFGLFFVHN
jgi:hypothetical protein